LNESILNQLIELAKLFNVTKLIQFGSSLESFEDCRDIDFACDGLYNKDFFRFGANLEKLFKKPVDLIPLQPYDPFTEFIIKNGKLIYESSTN
jgi:predicted nucleotidyltransferase